MEGVPPSFMDDYVNQLDFETLMSELPSSPPEEVPVNQSSISCNDQAGQNLLVNINDTIQQTTRFPPSFPQTMMEGAPPSSVEDDVNLTSNQLDFETFNMSELLLLPPEEVPVNQSSMLCNDQVGQNMSVDNNDSIQQTTQFPPSFPHTMTTMGGLDGTSSSWINHNGPNWPQTASSDQQWTNQLAMSNQVPGMLPQPPMNQCYRQFPYQFNQVPITPNLYNPQSSTMLPEPSQTLRSPPEEVPVNQAGQNMQVDSIQQTTQFPASFPQTMITMGGLDGTSSSWINQNDPQCSTMLPEPSQTLRSPQFPPHNLQVSGDHNQGQVDQASVIPHIENMQQQSLMPLNFDRSTRSQMENLQVHVLQDQIGRPNASNAGLDSSLQSQNSGLNTQQMEGVPPSFMEDYVNQLEGVPSLPLEEVPVNQSSMLCNDQAGQNMLVDNNDSTRQTTKFPPHQISGDHDLLNSNCYDSMFFEPTSSSRQRQQGHVNMTPNTTTSQHGGFNQPRPSLPATRSQMENPQVHVLQNQTAWPNASNPGPDNSLQSQNRGLNTQQVQRAGSRDPFWDHVEEKDDGSMICKCCERRWANKIPISRFKWHLSGEEGHGVAICPKVDKEVQEGALKAMRGSNKRHKYTTSSINVIDHGISTFPQEQNIENENMGEDIGRVQREDQVVEAGVGEERISSHAVAGNDIVSMTGMRAQEDRVSEGALESRLMTEPVDRELEQSNLAGTAGRTQVGVQGTEQGAREERIQSHSQAENAMEDTGEGSFRHAFQTIPRTEQVQHLERRSSCESSSINQADEPRGDSSQPSDPLCLDYGRYYDQPFGPLVSNDVIMNDVQNMVRARTEPVEEHDVANSGRLVQPDTGARSSESLKCNKTKGVPFPTRSNKPVGKAFERNRTVIWSLLMDNEVSTIGIYGMGGVGKTTILQHIHNELLEKPDICYPVWWVTVSQDFSINKLQNLIAKRLDLDLSSEDDDLNRAAKLSEELRKKQKWILILDDLWNSFEPHEVGIPSLLKGCKLILTTRSQTVCNQIACQRKIEVKPLSEGEAWTLFKENLGLTLSDEMEGIAKAVARECAGLPLGIITVAGSLRGVDDLYEWRNTLKKLKDSEFGNMKVFKLLRFSYDRLGDLALQQCLLYCALFPEDHMIQREELIGYLIDEGIINGMGRRQEAFDEGHTMLSRLQKVCLLESDKTEDGGKCVKMHDLIRDMAIQIMQEKSQVIVKAGAQLEELPNVEEWTENLTRVSLMRNSFEEIPSSHSPTCPNLSTLFLHDNRNLRSIADSFFKHFDGLKVLDLSETSIQNLPESISDLVSLTALLLCNCWNIRAVPSLEKLRALKRLDLCGTTLEKMPQGMECLTNLRCLRMSGCNEKEFPSGILPKLSHLQVLELGMFSMTVKGKEVGSLRNLDTLGCHFKGLSDFVEYLRSRNGIRSLRRILVGTIDEFDWEFRDYHFPSKTICLGNLNNNADRDFQVKFLNGIQGLYCERIDARSLCDVLSLESGTELEIIQIEECDSMESLFSSSWFCPAPLPSPSYKGIFSSLQQFHCHGCRNMKNLFPLVLLPNLANLELIRVQECAKLEEIIGATRSDEESREFKLPKLRYLTLFGLPELKRICSAKLICDSLEEIRVYECEKLEEIIGGTRTDEEGVIGEESREFKLPKLRSLRLSALHELKSICSSKLICDSLEKIELMNCEKLKRIPICLPLLENGQPAVPPSLKVIGAYPEKWWERVVEWEHPNAKEVFRHIVQFYYLIY